VYRYFDPVPMWYGNLEQTPSPPNPPLEGEGFNLHAITQRPMFMYHSWGSQNRWLRQIAARNYLYAHPQTLAGHGIADDDWAWIASPRGRIRVQVRAHAATAPGTLWTWNALGKKRGAWKLGVRAPEFVDGFLLNDLIGERDRSGDYSNADPVTGQAAWFDLRVRLEPDPQPRVPGHRVELHEGAGENASRRRSASA
jgi:anaerobic selenocysteine-containing dehydrogenase